MMPATGSTSSASNTDLSSPPAVQAKGKKSFAFHLTFVAVLINLFLYALDATTLAVATSTTAADLAGTFLESFWASISYLLAVVVTQPLYATLSDILGRKPYLYIAYTFSLASSIVFSLAHKMGGVIAGRILQGLDGGSLDILSEIVVIDMTTLQERSLYLGLMAILTAFGSVLGPTLRGVFSSLHSRLSQLQRFDWIGMPLFTTGTVLFALPLSWAGNLYAWDSFRTLLPLMLGVAILLVFAFYESKPAAPIMPHRIFRSRTASATLVGVFLHRKALQSAVSLLPTSAVSVVAAVGGVTVVGLVNVRYRWTIRISWVLTAGGGISLLLRLLYLPLQTSVICIDDTALAIGMLLTFRLLGGLVRLSICSTVFSDYFSRSIEAIGQLPPFLEHLRDPDAAVAFIPQLRTLDLPQDTLQPIIQAYLTSIRAIIYTMTGFANLGLLSSFPHERTKLAENRNGAAAA
ncbi:MFS general substrate transporter [Lentithecium fluviatile CBS 122367]|uniref:MFS general substrate transporter n=1 Tax=Lentithecium fluviatile CBS 122367 TaxID=1168545 RepID=A0A6G1JIC7_9PLEO|nr:MFS general substrate transporter [Lentithecium fluviatile CBS 122367]